MSRQEQVEDKWDIAKGAANVWRTYSNDEDAERTNEHYEKPVEFFTRITGGVWNVYSCNLWTPGQTQTGSQEAKLDLVGEMMGLRPGQRLLDIGCGWGGPLVYLVKRFGVKGVGLTLSGSQRDFAQRRADDCGSGVLIHQCHWKSYLAPGEFDAVWTDEVSVHFSDIADYFASAFALLKPGGVMLNKELHFTAERHKALSRAVIFVNKIYGETGNYRTLHEELRALDIAGFDLEAIQTIPLAHYRATLDSWLDNMQADRELLEELVGADYFRRYRTYLRLARRTVSGETMALDAVLARKP